MCSSDLDVLHRHPGIVFKDLQKLFHRCLSFVQPVAIFIDKYSTLPGGLHLVFASSAGDRHSFARFPCSFFQKECSFFVKSAILGVIKALCHACEATSPSRLRRATARVAAPSIRCAPLASCWPRPQQRLSVSATGGGRRCCSYRGEALAFREASPLRQRLPY